MLSRYHTDVRWRPDTTQVWATVSVAAVIAKSRRLGLARSASAARALHSWNTEHAESTGHDVEDFLRSVDPHDRLSVLHFGMTSSDVVDTASSLLLRRAANGARMLCDAIVVTLDDKAQNAGNRTGMTHGRACATTSWSHYWSVHRDIFARASNRLASAIATVCGKMSGPLGDCQHVSEAEEADAVVMLGLRRVRCLQPVPRDIVLEVPRAILALLHSVKTLATDCRVMLVDGVDALVYQNPGVSSSSMPHKNNPWRFERVCGLCDYVKSALRGVEDASSPCWLDRDICHSSAERHLPELLEETCFVLLEMTDLLASVSTSDTRSTGQESHATMVQGQTRGMGRVAARRAASGG